MRTRQFYFQFRDPNAGVNLNANARITMSSPICTGPALLGRIDMWNDGESAGFGIDYGYAPSPILEPEPGVAIAQPKPWTSLIEKDPVNGKSGGLFPPIGMYVFQNVAGGPADQWWVEPKAFVKATQFVFTFTVFDNTGAGFGNHLKILMRVIDEVDEKCLPLMIG